MTELLKTTTSMGTLTLTQVPPPAYIQVHIHRWGYDKTFGRDRIVSVIVGIGGGSLLGLKTVTIQLAGEKLVLRNVPPGPADYLRQVLS